MELVIISPDPQPGSQVKNQILSLAGLIKGFLVPDIGLYAIDSKRPVQGIFPPGKTCYPVTLTDQSFDQGHPNKSTAACNQNFH
jgi:hypothetical protein